MSSASGNHHRERDAEEELRIGLVRHHHHQQQQRGNDSNTGHHHHHHDDDEGYHQHQHHHDVDEVVEDDQGLWDELSHQQNREIEAHEERHSRRLLQQQQPQPPGLVRNPRQPPPPSFGGGGAARTHANNPPAAAFAAFDRYRYAGNGNANYNNNNNRDNGDGHGGVGGIWRQSREETSRLGRVFYDAVCGAWHEHREWHRERRRGSHSGRNRNHRLEQYLEEFGIPREGDEEEMLDHDLEGGDDRYGQYVPLRAAAGGGRGGEDAADEAGDFVHLGRLGVRRFRDRPPPRAAALSSNNLDAYYGSLYLYYYHRGLLPLVTKFCVEFASLAFTLALSTLLLFVDWPSLASCVDESSCRPFSSYVLGWNVHSRRNAALVVVYVSLFAAYAGFYAWDFGSNTLRRALAAKWVFEERLGISSRRLRGGAVDWDADVIQKLQQLHASGEYRVVVTRTTANGNNPSSNICNQNNAADNTTTNNNGQNATSNSSVDPALDALHVAQRVLRKENFMVAIINKGLVDWTIPKLAGGTITFFSSSLEWSLYFCILNFMFNHKYQIRPAFYLDPSALRRRFILCGIAHAVLMPFLLFFLMLHFVLRNAYDFKSTQQYLGPREWTLSSKWMFREFNEYPHLFEKRLVPSYAAADDYLKLFGPNEFVAAAGRIVVFVAGSLGAVLFVFAAINDAILLHVKIADWNLLWYAGVVGIAYSAGKAMIPSDYYQRTHVRNLFAETDAALSKVTQHTHYSLETWKGRGSDAATYKAVKSMFPYKAQLFLIEVASVILAPYILCVKWAYSAESICEFIFSVKADLGSGGGEVCGHATFNFDRYQDEAWDGKTFGSRVAEMGATATSLSESILRTGSVEAAARDIPVPRLRYGKTEKSFFSFKANHPSWKCCSASGQNLVDRIENYKRSETAALSRERQLHIEAAARQLEMLARIEERRQMPDQDVFHPGIRAIDETYITRAAQAHADAGAGTTVQQRGRIPPQRDPSPPAEAAREQQPNTSSLLDTSINISTSHEEALALPFATSTSPSPNQQSPSALLSSSLSSYPHQSHQASVSLHPQNAAGLSTGLSSEMRRILTLSTSLDPGVVAVGGIGDAMAASLRGGEHHQDVDDADEQVRRAERQYLWLERYHAHLNAQQQQGQHQHPPPQPLAPSRSNDAVELNTAHRQAAPNDSNNIADQSLGPSSIV